MIGIIVGPCLFYIPKFFELRADHSRLGIDVQVDCETVLNPPKINLTAFRGILLCVFRIRGAHFYVRFCQDQLDDIYFE